MGPYLSPRGTDEGFCAGVGDTQRGHGVGGGHACPIPYQIKHILGISALEADAGVF